FLQAIRLDDAFHTADTDGEAGLAELLGDDGDGGIGIEEAVADDLTFELLGADIVGLGSGLLALEGQGPLFSKSLEQLIIPLSGEAELLGWAGGAERCTW